MWVRNENFYVKTSKGVLSDMTSRQRVFDGASVSPQDVFGWTLFLRLRTLMVLSVLVVGAMLGSWCEAISYTVQVAALSDQDAALTLQRNLRAEGYPAYLVSVPSEEGAVYRLRVGAFANRAAALQFAESMQGVGGTQPVPALAEGIPSGLIPIEPEALGVYPYAPEETRMDLFPWGDAWALRVQSLVGAQEGRYHVLLGDEASYTFSAWRAVPAEDGWLIRVYSVRLWPSEHAELSQDEREAYQQELLASVADTLELRPEQVRPFLFEEADSGVPYLVLAERRHYLNNERERYRALGDPSDESPPLHGPDLIWFGRSEPEVFPRELSEAELELSEMLERSSEEGGLELSGNGWQAFVEGDYTRIEVADTGQAWRAMPGVPIWAYEDYLLVYWDGQIVLYALRRP